MWLLPVKLQVTTGYTSAIASASGDISMKLLKAIGKLGHQRNYITRYSDRDTSRWIFYRENLDCGSSVSSQRYLLMPARSGSGGIRWPSIILKRGTEPDFISYYPMVQSSEPSMPGMKSATRNSYLALELHFNYLYT